MSAQYRYETLFRQCALRYSAVIGVKPYADTTSNSKISFCLNHSDRGGNDSSAD